MMRAVERSADAYWHRPLQGSSWRLLRWLDLALLIERETDGMRRWRDMRANDGAQLIGKAGSVERSEVRRRCGCSRCSAQIRCTEPNEMPQAVAIGRPSSASLRRKASSKSAPPPSTVACGRVPGVWCGRARPRPRLPRRSAAVSAMPTAGSRLPCARSRRRSSAGPKAARLAPAARASKADRDRG